MVNVGKYIIHGAYGIVYFAIFLLFDCCWCCYDCCVSAPSHLGFVWICTILVILCCPPRAPLCLFAVDSSLT